MDQYIWFTIRTYAGFMETSKDAIVFSKQSTDDDNCESMAIEVEYNGGDPFVNKIIPFKHIRAIAELFTKWADELDAKNE